MELEAPPLMLEFIPLIPIKQVLILMKHLALILLYDFKYFKYLMQKMFLRDLW